MTPSRSPILFIVALAVATGAGLGFAGEAAAILPPGVRVLDPDQVLAGRTQREGDVLYLRDSEGSLRRFLTSAMDPAISNHGDGSFHPASLAVVQDAIESIDPSFVDHLAFEIDILPYPVDDPLGSWADAASIYICPGVYPLSDASIHFLISHEAGHLVHRTFLPDTDLAGWARYRALRGIADSTRYNAFAAHRDRPHEIFAEDFRVLFGGDLASRPAIENTDLADPRTVPGLHEFFVSLIARDGVATRPIAAVYPNPLGRGDLLRFARPADEGTTDLTLYDLSGRQVRAIRGLQANAGGLCEVAWDGLDDAGRRLPLGVYFGKVRSGNASAASFTIHLIR